MNNLTTQLQTLVAVFNANLPFMLGFVGVFWGVQLLNALLRYRLNILGTYPRSWHGLIGILFTPLLHGDFGHLFLNSVPLFVLGSFLLLGGHHHFWQVNAVIVIGGGLLLWLFGRKAMHVGASGLVMGYFGYLLIQAYFHPSVLAIVVAVTSVYYFGGLFLALFPGEARTSWEGHVFGFIAGIGAFWLFH